MKICMCIIIVIGVYFQQLSAGERLGSAKVTNICSIPNNDIVNNTNIEDFKGCEKIIGDLIILDKTFDNMPPDKLEIFHTVKTITGILHVETLQPNLKNLSYFRNLEVIQGHTPGISFSLNIYSTSLESLYLSNLKSIKGKGVFIMNNDNLCYTNSVQWKTIVDVGVGIIVEANRNSDECQNDGMICDSQCSDEGCWGPGPDKCLSCSNYMLSDKCVDECDPIVTPHCRKACPSTMFEQNGTCLACDEQCSGCYGPTANKCRHCKYLNDNSTCMQTCPLKKYTHKNVDCLPCPGDCVVGCSEEVRNGKIECYHCVRIDQEETDIKCRKTCPSGYFDKTNVNNQRENEVICGLCDVECKECNGPGPSNCKACKNVSIYKSEKKTSSNKSRTCASEFVEPKDYPHCFRELHQYRCYEEIDEKISFLIYIILIWILMLGLITFFLIRYKYKKKQNHKHSEEEFTLIPIHSQTVDRNFEEQSLIMKGTFYKNDTYGKLYLGCKNNSKSIVIKILHKHIFQNPKIIKDVMELLSSLKHIYLFEVEFKISKQSEIMVITQEMPFGNLMEYMRNNRYEIKPINQLKWCKQTAEGMKYLEFKSVVHGDLAARNLMLHVEGNIKIKDFGFVYLLDASKQKISALKRYKEWQALEYQAGKPTHKTDVWAFGVTAWEVLTFGKDPRDFITYSSQNYRSDLDKGIRMPCPQICKDVMYNFLSNCWYIVPEKRPSFEELLKALIQMSVQPNKYINTTRVVHRSLLKHKRNRHPLSTCY